MPYPGAMRTGYAILTLIGLYLSYVGWIAEEKRSVSDSKSER